MGEGAILDTIASEMPLGVVVLDADKKVLYSNRFFARCFHLDCEISGTPVNEIISDTALLAAIDGFMEKGESGARDIEISESERCFKVRVVPQGRGQELNLLLFIQEITEEKSLEAIKRDFVANVSHELRTPLASIKGCSETLLDGAMDDPGALSEFLGIIDKHATRMSRLIHDLLTLSRIESEPMPIDHTSIDAVDLIRSTTKGFAKEARDKGIELEVKAEDSIPRVLGDHDRLEQVMVNLLDNAIKYTPTGGRVEVSVLNENNEVRVDVSDTGIGIPPGDMPRLFERFYRVDKARSRELGGTGLGLAIVKHIIQGHHGRVWAESTLGQGSCFSFTLQSVP